MKLWEPKRKCPKAVPRHLQNLEVWSRVLKRSVKSYMTWPSTTTIAMDFYSCRSSHMASNGSCFMITWTIFKNHILEVDLTQNRKTMALRTLTTIDLFNFIMREDLHEWNFTEIAFGWGTGHIWHHTALEGPWPHYMILEVCWDGLWTLSFGLPQFHGHGSRLVCEVALK
jgi:hypothetical protein